MRERLMWCVLCAIGLVACGSEEPTLHAEPSSEAHAESAGSCEHHEEGAAAEAPATDGPQPSAVLADGARQFGAALSDRAETTLADIAAAPGTFDGQTVRTEGHIERVCQRMGCWMEITSAGTS